MALEDKIAELIDALNRNTAVTENLMNLRAATIEEIKGAAKGTPAAAAPKAEKPAAEAPKAEKPAAAEAPANITATPEDRKDPANPETGAADPYDALAKVIGGFVGMDDNADLRNERAAVVKKLFAHPKINAANHKEVPEAMIPVVIANIEKVTPDFKAKSDAAKAAPAADSDDLLAA